VAYRSKIKYTLEGDTTVTTYTTAPGTIVPSVSGPTKADLTLPASMSISVVHDLSEQWRLLGDITYTNWSSVDTLNVMNSSTGATRDQLVLKFDNAYRFSLGATYKASDQWSFKVGAALDQSPVNDQYRSVRLPDNDRTWLSMGAKYSISKATSVDIGYTHIFIKDAPINNARTQYGQSAATFTSVVNGNYTGSVDVLSVQLAASF
jgi:long-chain fatty acid transport protein